MVREGRKRAKKLGGGGGAVVKASSHIVRRFMAVDPLSRLISITSNYQK